MKLFLFLLLSTSLLIAHAHTPPEWRSRSIYQILTDRFARTDGDTAPCHNISDYCGGTFKGIADNLEYIQGMGFNAIWISPVIANTPGGYHGYWAQNLYEINSNFGTAEDLKNLVEECHKRDIWVMVDVVANHMAPLTPEIDYHHFHPFNDSSYFHDELDCQNIEPDNQTQLEICWLSKLPDLNQNIPFVKDQLIEWISQLIVEYKFDGLRVDTVPYVAKEFWKEFTDASGVYTVGEVWNRLLPYSAGYEGYVDGVLNYPMFYTVRDVFQSKSSMYEIETYYRESDPVWKDFNVLGNFVDNHDNARFLHGNGDKVGFKAALAFVLTSVGIPITYYGSEQAYGGGDDPENREPLWTNVDVEADIYKFLALINGFRTSSQFYEMKQVQRYADDHFYAFTRGEHFFAFTNTQEKQQRTITYHEYPNGTVLCNMLSAEEDCTVVKDNEFDVILNDGEVKILVPKHMGHVWDSMQETRLVSLFLDKIKREERGKGK